jgi:hypothetical protein
MEEIFSYGWSGIRNFFRKNYVALLYTVIVHLVVCTILVFMKVDALKKTGELGIQLEFEEKTLEDYMEEEEMEVPAEWLDQVMARTEAASNRAVNVNAENKFSEDISTNDYVKDLLEQIAEARNQQDREKLEELQAILAAADYVPPPTDDATDEESEYTGPTNITYEFTEEPKLRRKVNLTIPVYRCQGSGLVKVEVTVNRDGSVSEAKVLEPIEGNDRVCFSDAALAAALSSKFRIDSHAPEKHRALITYSFVAQ